MAKSIKIPDETMALVRREAELNSRSIAGQLTHWIRIGRSIEQSPDFSYAQVRDALSARLSPDALSGKEQALYLDALLAAAAQETPEQQAFFEERRAAGLGVGDDKTGKLVAQKTKR